MSWMDEVEEIDENDELDFSKEEFNSDFSDDDNENKEDDIIDPDTNNVGGE